MNQRSDKDQISIQSEYVHAKLHHIILHHIGIFTLHTHFSQILKRNGANGVKLAMCRLQRSRLFQVIHIDEHQEPTYKKPNNLSLN